MIRCFLPTISALLVLAAAPAAYAEAPPMLSYQGFLTDSVGNPVSGEWTLTFGLYGQNTGGEALFVDSQDVTTDKGLFSLYLGSEANPLSVEALGSGELYLEITVETDDGPIVLKPRAQVVSDPYALFSNSCENANQLGGQAADAYVTVQQLPDVCVAPEDLPDVLIELGYLPGGGEGLDEVELAAWLLANGYSPCVCYGEAEVANYLDVGGYVSGPHFSGLYGDLSEAPDLTGFLTEPEVLELLGALGAVLLADGSVALEGPLDFAGFEAVNLVVEKGTIDDPPDEITSGQLWFDTTNKMLRIWDGDEWAPLGGTGIAADVSCPECVGADDVSFTFAAADQKGGAALAVNCFQCISEEEVSFAWAKGVAAGGDAEHALTADEATSAVTAEEAQGLECAGCVGATELAPEALTAGAVLYDDSVTQFGADNVQDAFAKLAVGGAGGDVNEGNGTIVAYEQQWGLPSYGKGEEYVHLMNPASPKVLAWLYASESTSFATSNNLVVAYDHAPNKYSEVTQGDAGSQSVEVSNPSVFNYGNHILLHQFVGTGGNGTGAGNWELNQVIGVNGNTLSLAKPLDHTYTSGGCDTGRAQAVVAASYNLLEVVNGGQIRPSEYMPNTGEARGGIVYIRARKIVVKTGGQIVADTRGFKGGNDHNCNNGYHSESGHSQCSVCDNQQPLYHTSPNCSGGGGGDHSCSSPGKGGGGGGGNMVQGGNGTGSAPGSGGNAVGDAQLNTLHFGGGGGRGWPYDGGHGGGIIVLGSETIIVEAGGKISANGGTGQGCDNCNSTYAAAGGGAGGTIALFANQVVNEGTISTTGGAGGQGQPGNGGNGGEGWVVQLDPISGVVNESYPKGIEIWVDDQNVTSIVGDPNAKGAPSWDDVDKKWGQDGLTAWSTGQLDLSSVANWTLGEHRVEMRETGGAGGELKFYMYIVYPFTKSSAPVNDTCQQPVQLDLTGPATVSGTTEDVMGKIKATDANVGPFCGGTGGPDVVYTFTLEDWRQISVSVVAAFLPRVYIRKDSCADGDVVACGNAQFATGVLEPGTYYIVVDSDGNLQKGDFSLTVTPSPPGAPPNDSCAQPEQLSFDNNVAKSSGMTLFSTDQYSAACGGAGAPENVFQFTVPAGIASLSISLETDFSPAMYVVKDNCAGAPIACIPAAQYQMGWPGGGTYYLFLDGKTANDKGLYTLTVTLEE